MAMGLSQQPLTMKVLVQSQVSGLWWTEWYLVRVCLQTLVFLCEFHH